MQQGQIIAESIVAALHGRRVAPSRWIACCPAHEDHSPSLSISQRDGKLLLHCFAGCAQADVIAALRARGLWPEQELPYRSPADRRRWAAERAEVERQLPTARYWRRAAAKLCDELLTLLKASIFDPTAGLEVAANEIYDTERLLARLRRLDDAELVDEYRWWAAQRPGLTAALVREAKLQERRDRQALLRFLRSYRGKP